MKNFSFILFSFLVLISCSSNKTLSNTDQFKLLNKQSGLKKNIELSFLDYRNKKLRIVIPKDITTPKPLVIALHWAGSGDIYKEYSQCLVEPSFMNLDCYIISPDSEGMLWTNKYNENKILDLISLAKQNWNIDTSKIIVTGYSNGGNGAWFFAERHPNIFKAAIPMASAYPINSKIDVQLYVIHGAEDELFPIEKTKKWIFSSRKAGSDIVFIPIPKYSHFMACNYVDELKKAVEWLNF